jgi:hypothetical protein
MRSLKVLLMVVLFSATLFAADDPLSGTWKFNPSKGHLTPPVPKSVIAHVDVTGEDFKFREEGTDEKSQPFNLSYDAKFDGKEYPVTGDPNSDTVSLHRVSQREVKFTLKKGGKLTSKLDVVVSKDGQTTTVNYTDYNEGKAEKGSAVYDKQ